jgi:acyl-CoA synthetase (AMP-forming)/AMP-acid ligase II
VRHRARGPRTGGGVLNEIKDGLLGWLDEPATERGVRFARGSSEWEAWTWAEIASAAHGAAARMLEVQSARTGTVAIVIPNSPEFIASFYGSLIAGLTPCPLAPPKAIDDPQRYLDHLAGLLEVAKPALVVTVAECHDALSRLALDCPLLELSADRSAPEHPRARPPEVALLQFTSGSSGRPRAVRVTQPNLEANLSAVISHVAMDPHADEVVTWLPTYHDMGLIGCTLTPVAASTSLSMLRVEDFVRRPMRWLECLGSEGEAATITATPPFGFGLALKRVRDEDVAELDFSRWRVAMVGAERVDAAVLQRFLERFRESRLSPSVFYPAYGLAEATLMVSAKHGARPPTAIRPDWSSLQFGRPVTVDAVATLADPEELGDGVDWLVSCGVCPPGVGVGVVGEDGAPLPEGTLGELAVTGEGVTAGYLDEPEVTAERFAGGALRTGDAALLHDGELYVFGRMADALKVHGRWLSIEEVEAKVLACGAVPRGRTVLFSGRDPEGDAVIALTEAEPGEWVSEVAAVLAAEVPDTMSIHVLSGGWGTILRTSSGKPRRRAMWEAYLAGTLGAQVVYSRTANAPHGQLVGGRAP